METENKILIVDIETTHLKPDQGHIVEIGICQLDVLTGKRVMLFDNVMWEDGITKKECENAWIVRNSSLTVEMIRQSKNLKKYRDNIQHIIHSHQLGITAFNHKFDFDWLEDRGFHIEFKLPCLMKVSKPIVKAKNAKGNVKNPNVTEAFKHFIGSRGTGVTFPRKGEPYVEEHRGGADAMDEAEIAFLLCKTGKLKLLK